MRHPSSFFFFYPPKGKGLGAKAKLCKAGPEGSACVWPTSLLAQKVKEAPASCPLQLAPGVCCLRSHPVGWVPAGFSRAAETLCRYIVGEQSNKGI